MLDTKSKNNKKYGIILAAVTVIIASFLFRSFYPVFTKKVQGEYSDAVHSNQFIEMLRSYSYVLFKDITEQVEGKELSYAELYLETQLYPATSDAVYNDYDNYYSDDNYYYTDGTRQELTREGATRGAIAVNDSMQEQEINIIDALEGVVDYCVIDDKTGQMIKNTGKDIELAAAKETGGIEENDFPYVYYIKVSCDSNGKISSISTKSTQSDALLKKVRTRMQTDRFQENIISLAEYWENGSVYSLKEGDEYKLFEAAYTAKKVLNDTTVIYALTQEQKEKLNSAEYAEHSLMKAEEAWAYDDAGVSEVFRIMLVVTAVLALWFTRWKGYHLHRRKAARMPFEIAFLAGSCIFITAADMMITVVQSTDKGYLNETFFKYIEWLPSYLYPVITDMMNMGCLILVFGTWYYLITTVGELFDLGIKEFFHERGLTIKLCRVVKGLCVKFVNKVKLLYKKAEEEILHVDLGQKTNKVIFKIVLVNFMILAVLCMMWMFGWFGLFIYSVILYFLIKRYIQKIQEQYGKVLDATSSIAAGNLNTSMELDWGVFESYKKELSTIQTGFGKAVEEEVKSQRMKTELITNVSHDLKTPLTAMTTYIELLKEDSLPEEKRREYTEVLERKSQRLKALIEDLFEVSKANSKNVRIELTDVDICSLMRQVYLEFEEKVEEANLIFRFQMPENKVILQLDSQKTYRIFENLYSNIIKYAMPHTRVYINTEKTESGIRIEIKNMSAIELNIEPNELTERFVRGDSARNTEGSGLGLAIARSFAELQNGKLEVEIDGDLFKVILQW